MRMTSGAIVGIVWRLRDWVEQQRRERFTSPAKGTTGTPRGLDSRRLHVLIGPAAGATMSVCCTMKTVSMRKFARHVRLARARHASPGGWRSASSVSRWSADASRRRRRSETPMCRSGKTCSAVSEIRGTHDRKKLHAELVHLLAHLRRAHGTTASARRGREFALRGFEATLKGVRSQLDFSENDSGEVAAATRDAKRAAAT